MPDADSKVSAHPPSPQRWESQDLFQASVHYPADHDSEEEIQPMEIGMDAGYQHVGVSVKSAKREYFSAQFDLLKDEKQHHDDCRKYRRSRRNRLRHRPCRFDKDTKPEGWIPPSLRHKAEVHIRIVENICKVAPIRKVTVEVGEFDPALLKAMYTGKEPPQGKDYQQGPLYFADSLRAAVFQRDQYTCQICGKSAIKSKEPVHLHTHHALYWKGHHANTLNELITVCSDCHTPENHQKGGKLWGLTPDVPRLEGATFMNGCPLEDHQRSAGKSAGCRNMPYLWSRYVSQAEGAWDQEIACLGCLLHWGFPAAFSSEDGALPEAPSEQPYPREVLRREGHRCSRWHSESR